MSRFERFRYAFVKSIPILCSYIFLGAAFGILMEECGFPWYDALLVSFTVYTGAFQFVLPVLLTSGASLMTICGTALFMNSRQVFYGLTFCDEFRRMGKYTPYMICTLTDETYAVNCTLKLEEEDRHAVMFWVAFLSRCYWMIGTVLGGILGQVIPFDMTGIDFCMTAMFILIFMDQWKDASADKLSHVPAMSGLGIGLACLLFFGENGFILPALLLVSVFLIVWQRGTQGREEMSK